uniref:Mediator of RNA polymerase II transcription subunit 30 n=1 Tax=Denticeps clupeoides TaxID=299321 RepID=A0AAY4EPH9_9TELE
TPRALCGKSPRSSSVASARKRFRTSSPAPWRSSSSRGPFRCVPSSASVKALPARSRSIDVLNPQLPNGVTQSQSVYQDRFGKLQEHLRQLTLLFRKLRLLYDRCVEMTSDLQEAPAELVPYVGVEMTSARVEPCSPAVSQEKQDVLEKVRQKNLEMKALMDQMRNLLWDVNAMLTLR